MFSSNVLLAAAAWVFLPFVAFRSAQVQLLSRRLWTDIQDRLGRVTTVLQENLTGVRVVKAFSREEFEEEGSTARQRTCSGRTIARTASRR
jgi:ATP-binding cassette subfamily B protein